MRMQETPDKLPRNVFQSKRKSRMLENSVVAALKTAATYSFFLVFCDFCCVNYARRIAGSRSAYGKVKRFFKIAQKLNFRSRAGYFIIQWAARFFFAHVSPEFLNIPLSKQEVVLKIAVYKRDAGYKRFSVLNCFDETIYCYCTVSCYTFFQRLCKKSRYPGTSRHWPAGSGKPAAGTEC